MEILETKITISKVKKKKITDGLNDILEMADTDSVNLRTDE